MCTLATADSISETVAPQETGSTSQEKKSQPMKPPRGLTAKELLQSNRWLDGPKFLWQQDPLPLQPPPIYALHPSDLEVRKNLASTLSTKTEKVKTSHTGPGILKPDRFNHFSSLNRLKRCIVQVQRAIERLRPNNVHKWRPKEGPSSLKELSRAENIVLRSIQHYHMNKRSRSLVRLKVTTTNFRIAEVRGKKNSIVKLNRNLHKLDPFIDKQGLLRVGGRLKSATSPYAIKHPVILPKGNHTTVLLIR